jgi:hypothetical protein
MAGLEAYPPENLIQEDTRPRVSLSQPVSTPAGSIELGEAPCGLKARSAMAGLEAYPPAGEPVRSSAFMRYAKLLRPGYFFSRAKSAM